MNTLFEYSNSLMNSNFIFVLLGTFIWGILSIILSPCHLTSIPLIIGFIDSSEVKTTQRRFLLSFLFSLGILFSIGLIGVITSFTGRIAGDLGSWTNWLAALIFAIIGLHFLDIISLKFKGLNDIPINQKGKLASLFIGLLFGVALGPCTFAFMAPVLAVTLIDVNKSIIQSTSILITYGIGHSLLIILAGTFTGMFQKYLNWNSETGNSKKVKKVAGIFLLIGSLYFLSK